MSGTRSHPNAIIRPPANFTTIRAHHRCRFVTATEVMGPCQLGAGHDHPVGWCCGAKLRQGPGYDRRRAGWGTDHPGVGPCKLHLGSTRNHRVAAQRMLAERGAAASLSEFGYEPIGDPVEELLDLAGRIRGFVDYFSAKVDELGDEVRYASEKDTEQLRSEMALLERFIGQLHRVLGDLARLDLDARRVRLAEDRGAQLAAVLDVFAMWMLARVLELGFDESAGAVVRGEIPAALRTSITATLAGEAVG